LGSTSHATDALPKPELRVMAGRGRLGASVGLALQQVGLSSIDMRRHGADLAGQLRRGGPKAPLGRQCGPSRALDRRLIDATRVWSYETRAPSLAR